MEKWGRGLRAVSLSPNPLWLINLPVKAGPVAPPSPNPIKGVGRGV
jgi:hypothetical protein